MHILSTRKQIKHSLHVKLVNRNDCPLYQTLSPRYSPVGQLRTMTMDALSHCTGGCGKSSLLCPMFTMSNVLALLRNDNVVRVLT